MLQQTLQNSTMLMFCVVSRAMLFSIEANEITLCKLHISGEYIKANEIVEYTEKRRWIFTFLQRWYSLIRLFLYCECSRMVNALMKSKKGPKRKEWFPSRLTPPTSFPGSLFSASLLNDKRGREGRPWERGCTSTWRVASRNVILKIFDLKQ